jgi:RNA polymerase sigma-70 factor (ECF subfamily)
MVPAGDAESFAPHCDPRRFDEVVASVSPESLLVVIEHCMGPALREQVTAEDLWQETLALAWRDRAQHTWTGARAFRAWLVTIAKNRIRDVARTLGRDKRGAGERPLLFSGIAADGSASLSALLPAGSTTPSRIAGAREQAQLIRAALAELPEELREIVRLHLFEEQTMGEVARALGITIDTAWYRFRKGAALYAQSLRVLRSQSRPERTSP